MTEEYKTALLQKIAELKEQIEESHVDPPPGTGILVSEILVCVLAEAVMALLLEQKTGG